MEAMIGLWIMGHITHDRIHKSFINMFEHELPHKVKLGDDYQYPIKEVEKLHTS